MKNNMNIYLIHNEFFLHFFPVIGSIVFYSFDVFEQFQIIPGGIFDNEERFDHFRADLYK